MASRRGTRPGCASQKRHPMMPWAAGNSTHSTHHPYAPSLFIYFRSTITRMSLTAMTDDNMSDLLFAILPRRSLGLERTVSVSLCLAHARLKTIGPRSDNGCWTSDRARSEKETKEGTSGSVLGTARMGFWTSDIGPTTGSSRGPFPQQSTRYTALWRHQPQ